MLKVIKESARERCESRDGELIEINGEADHVHLLVSLPPHIAISEYVNAIKTNTARVLRRDFAAQLKRFYSEPVLSGAAATVRSVSAAHRSRSSRDTSSSNSAHIDAGEDQWPGARFPRHQARRLRLQVASATDSLGRGPLGRLGG